MDDAPLILTLRLDAQSFARFDDERRRHFPPDRNVVPAHLTLFHHLPGVKLDDISHVLAAAASRHPSFDLTVSSLRFLGQGTAYVVDSAELTALRAMLATNWAGDLTRQDAQAYRPHITIQNKARPEAARALFDVLSESFQPFRASATGLLLWRYRNGPWEPAGDYAFSRAQDDAARRRAVQPLRVR